MSTRPEFPLLSNPWIFFCIYLTTNLALSFADIPTPAKFVLVSLGLLLPFLVSLRSLRPTTSVVSPFSGEMLPSVPGWVWILLAAAMLFVRFYKLTTLSPWLNFDEAFEGYLALDLLNPGHWKLNLEGVPYYSIYPWGLAVLFKCFQPSLFWLWFYPAFLSVLVVLAGYFSYRTFFSRSFSLLTGLLLAFSFWPLYLGHLGIEKISVVLIEYLAMLALGLFLTAKGSPKE